MEASEKPAEDNPPPKSTGSLVQISSIWIELKIPKENNETKCCRSNFSIRGFASEMRKKNPQASNPFVSDGNCNGPEVELPPMHVPKFRWWRCLECRRKIENSATEEIKVHSNCCTQGLASSSTSLNVPSHGDITMELSGTQQVPTAQRSEGIGYVDINAPPSMTSFHDSQLSSVHQEKTDAETGYAAATGGDSGAVEPVTDKAGDTRDEETIAQIGNTIATGDDKGPIGQVNRDDGNREIPREFQQSTDFNSAEIPLDAKRKFADAKQRTKRMPSRAGDGSHIKVEAAVSTTVNLIEVAPLQVEECGDTSSESDEDMEHENSSGLSRRKKKLRSMTDLLGDKGNFRTHRRKEYDSSAVPSGSGIHVSQGQVAYEDIRKSTKSPQRKGKMPQKEPEGITGPGIIVTHESMSKADSERTVTDIAICSSEVQANASSTPSSGVRLQIGNKNDRSKRKTEKTPAMVKRKNKQIQAPDRFLPMPAEKPSSKNNIKEGDLRAATANNLFGSSGTSSTAGETDSHSRNSESPQVPEGEQIGVTQTASQIPKSQPSNLKVGLDLSLDSFPEKIDSFVNKGKASSSTSVLEENHLHFGQCSILHASEAEVLGKKRQSWDLNVKIAQNSTNLVEKRKLSLQKEPSCHKEKTHDVQECPNEINEQSDQAASNKTGQGSLDDIPMEIVELMAKNQYERGLADAGNQSFRQRSNNNMTRFPEMQGMGSMTQFAKGLSGLTSFSPANDARGVLTIRGADAAAAKGNSINYPQMNRNHFEIIQPEKSKVSLYNMFPQNQQIFSRGARYPASASVRIGLQCSERAETLASSSALNMSFGRGLQQKYPQNPESQHRGKTISDIRAEELKKTQEARFILSKPGSSELTSNPKGPLDPYANESIPAMQLLSLMDGRSTGNTFNMGSSKPFTPCAYHPRYSTTERRDFLNGSLFQRQNRLVTGTFSVGESSGRSSGRHPFAFSDQPQEQDQSYLAKYACSISYTGQTSSRAKDKQKAIVVASDCVPYVQQNSERSLATLENESIAEDVQPLGSIPPEEHNCITNRNPAEYFLPDAENPFTISWKDLKFLKKNYARANDGVKRQRISQKQGKSNNRTHPLERTK